MDSTILVVIGVLMGILIFGVKTGVGCGFSNLKRKEILAIAGSYFILSLILGIFVDYFSMDNFQRISSMGMNFHVLLSLVLIAAGIYTQKKWNSGCDVSRKTFLVISMPCPVCLAALAVSCMLLASSLEIGGLKIGLLVGTVFFVSVLASSFLFKKMGKTPETLGSAMLLLGIYYLLGALLIPAYMKTKQLNLAPLEGGSGGGALPLLIFGIVILGGFFLERVRYNQ
ncbi:MAG: DUF2162 family putative transporter [Methanosarcinaceae archaeon]|nr:DUF2162 family putative transporter [Methanosarcinaceae archaeon]